MGEWRVVVENYRESVWENGNILNMDGGDSCTTLQMYLILLNCILEKWLRFLLCIFHHNEKIGKRSKE